MLQPSDVSPKKGRFSFYRPQWLVIGGLVSVLVTGGGLVYLLRSEKTDLTPPAATATPTTITALGRLEPQGEILKISISSNNNRIAQLLVEEGDRVSAGQVIAILDSGVQATAALDKARSDVQVAQARLEQVKAGAKQGDIVAQDARFERTQEELIGQITTQKASIASLQAQLQGEDLTQQATIEGLQVSLVNAQQDCQRYQMLHTEGVVSLQERDRFCLQSTTAAASLKEAKANLQRTVATLDKQIKENQATLEAVTEVRPVDVQVAEADLMAARAVVKQAQADLELAQVRAPKAGEVLKVHTRAGELISNDGIVELGQTSQMYAVAEVYETDITNVKPGQAATVTSDAFSQKLSGTVERVGRLVRRQNIFNANPTADTDGRIIEVRIRLDRASSRKVSGLTNQRVRVAITL
jgi:ABC exporter DevB family membrane fusion protein